MTVDLPADPAGLRALLRSMMTLAWEADWRGRLRDAQHADLASVRRTIDLILELATARHDAGDAAGFRAWAVFIVEHASGRRWEVYRK